jgi:hypothetical protein
MNAINELRDKVLIRGMNLANIHKANAVTDSMIKTHIVVSIGVIKSILSTTHKLFFLLPFELSSNSTTNGYAMP